MKDKIKKILKEESENWDDKLSSPDISMSPRTRLMYAQHKYGWEEYIPEISRVIKFDINPEEWNHLGDVSIGKVESKGHGSFGDDGHKNFQPSVLDDLHPGDDRYRVWYGGKGKYVGHREESEKASAKSYVDVEDAIDDMKGFSEESKRMVSDYKNKVLQLTSELTSSLSTLRGKYNYDSKQSVALVTVDSEGNYKSEADFDGEGNGFNYRDFDTLYGEK